MTTIELLERAGYEVRISHFRPLRWNEGINCACGGTSGGFYSKHDLNRMGAQGSAFSSRGGMTLAVVIPRDEDEPATAGIAFCSKRDNFCRRTGRELALDRALLDI